MLASITDHTALELTIAFFISVNSLIHSFKLTILIKAESWRRVTPTISRKFS